MPPLRERFLQRFGRPPAVVARAPGRVNLIGEHTDYNEGFVLPMALQQCTWAAAAPRDDGRICAVTLGGPVRTHHASGGPAGPGLASGVRIPSAASPSEPRTQVRGQPAAHRSASGPGLASGAWIPSAASPSEPRTQVRGQPAAHRSASGPGLASGVRTDTGLADQQTWLLGAWTPADYPHWTAYVASVATLLTRSGARVPGCDLLITSDVPVGSGLSSSAALEVACALAFARLAEVDLDGRELADLCRAAEHEFAGVPCGIMDQYISVLAQPGCALWLDCRARTWEHVPLPLGEYVVLIVNSGVHHELATSEYARRQADCRAAVERLRTRCPAATALRDVTPALLADTATALPNALLRRARHVVTENGRTCAAVEALRRGDLPAFGRYLDESHVSLRDDYEVSCRDLDLLVEIVRGVPGVLGARLTGGGFGGCLVAIAARDSVPRIEARVRSAYDGAGYGPATLLLSEPGAGAALA